MKTVTISLGFCSIWNDTETFCAAALYSCATPAATDVSSAAFFFDPSGGPAGSVARPGVGPIEEFELELEPESVPETVGTLAAGAAAGAMTGVDLAIGGAGAIGAGGKIVAVAAAA